MMNRLLGVDIRRQMTYNLIYDATTNPVGQNF